jgi:hypothetical protein
MSMGPPQIRRQPFVSDCVKAFVAWLPFVGICILASVRWPDWMPTLASLVSISPIFVACWMIFRVPVPTQNGPTQPRPPAPSTFMQDHPSSGSRPATPLIDARAHPLYDRDLD